MKKLSKFLTVGMSALFMVSSLAACGGNAGGTEKTTAAKTEVQKTEAKKTEAEKTEAEKTEAEKTEAEKTEAPSGSGMSGKINVYTRDSNSGTRGAFEELVGFKGELTGDAAETSGNGDMAAKVGADKNAIGYVSLTTDFEQNNLKKLALDGVVPSEETVLDGSYKLKRPFAYVTRAAGNFADDKTEQLVKAFIDYLENSTEGREIVASEGGIVDVAGGTAWSELKAKHPIVDEDNTGLTIRTGGSTSVEKTLKAALEAFKPEAGNFEFVMNQTGSGDAFKRTLGEEKDSANAIDIGFASREFKDSETVKDGMLTGTYCQDAVVVALEASNPVETMNMEQVKDIFTGKVTDWSEIK